MEQLDFNNIKIPIKNIYPQNRISNYNKKNQIEIKSFPEYTIQENKKPNKSLSIFKLDNSINPQTSYQNNENILRQNTVLTNYYSYPVRKNNSRQNNISNRNNNLFQQYSLKTNLQSKNYLNYLQFKRNTYDQYNDSNIKNKINSDIENFNTNKENEYINNNFNKKIFIQNNNAIQNEEHLLLSKLNSSKSTNEFYIGDEQDLLIEYNDAPVINNNRNNFYYLNSFSNENASYKNKKNLKYGNNEDSFLNIKKHENINTCNNRLNYESYINNSINRNKNLFTDNYFDIDLSCIKKNNNNYISNDKNYNFLLNQKKEIFDKHKKEIKITNENDKIYYYNPVYDNYQINSCKNIYDYNKNEKMDINKNNKNLNSGLTTGTKRNNSINKNQNNFCCNGVLIPKISSSNNIKNNRKININNGNKNKKSQPKKNNNQIKDIFYNKDYKNILKNNNPSKKTKSISNDRKIYINNKNINYKENKNQLNHSKNLKQKNNDNDIYEIFEDQNPNNANKKNKKNLSNRHKIILFKKDKVNNVMNICNSVDLNSKEKLKEYNSNKNNCYENYIINKKSNLTECYNSQESFNDYESKLNSNRYNNSRILNDNIFSTEILDKDFCNTNIYGHKSSKNITKKNKILNNFISERKKISTSPPPQNINYHSNKNINNKSNNINNKNIINIDINDFNNKYDYKNNNNNISTNLSNKKENKDINYQTEYNINTNNNEFLKNKNKKYIIRNNNNYNEDSCSILKSINYNNHLNNNPVKLYLKKNEIKYKKEFFKENNNNIDKIYINNYLKHINLSTKNTNNNLKIKKYYSTADNTKSNDNNFLNNNNKKNNKIININNNTSNVNVLTVKNSSINICIEKKDKLNILSPSKNINYITSIPTEIVSSIPTKKNNHKNNEINVKNVANELFEKNKNLKNINIIKPRINKANTNFINSQSNPYYIKISTNTIRYNNNLNINKNEHDNSKSNIDNQNKNNNNINKKKLIINNSEMCLFNKNKLNIASSNININNKENKKFMNNLKEKNINNKNINNKYKVKDIKYYELKNNNINIIQPVKPVKQENNINIIKNYKKTNIPLAPTNSCVQLEIKNNNINNSPKGVYIKPYCIISMPKSKKIVVKSKSELKIDNNIVNKNDNNANLISPIKNIKKTSKSFDIYFNTSPTFYQKYSNFKKNIGPIKNGIKRSLNTSTLTKIISTYNIHENENNISYDNSFNLKKSIIKINVRESYPKVYCFISKKYNYFIKRPKIERCYFIKNIKKNNINIKKPIKDINQRNIMIQEIFINNNNDEEKNNESSQNGLIMTFGEMNNNNKKNNEKSNAIINSNSKINDNYIIEDSDLDIYKSLQQGSSQNKNKNEKVSNGYSSSNVNNSENEDIKIYESIEKEKNLSKIFNNEFYKSTNGKEIEDEDDFDDKKKSKTFKKSYKYKLENAEKGLKILRKIVLRRGLKSNDESSSTNIQKFYTQDIDNSNHKNENIFLGTNKLNEFFNSRKETDSSNKDISSIKKELKYSKSVNKDIMQGISKIENIFQKNKIELTDNKINTYDAKNKINYDNNSKYNEYYDITDYSEIIKTKIRTYMPKSKTNLCSSNENITFDSYDNNLKFPRYKESEILSNKQKNEIRSSNEGKDSILPIKCNLLNEQLFNNSNDLFSYSEESNNYFNIKNNFEEYEKYLKEIKIKQSANIIKHELIFLLNLLVESNYSNILNQVTKIILYKDKDNILNDNDIIIENIHLFKNIIFDYIFNDIKYTLLYAQISNDLYINISNALSVQKNMKNNKERNLKVIINDECISILNNLKNIEINKLQNKEKEEYYYLRKKIIGYAIFTYELIKLEFLKQQFGFHILEQFYKLYDDNKIYCFDCFMEAIIILLNKLGKYILEKNNTKLIQKVNNYIDNNLSKIINNYSYKLPSYIRYKIMNLITRKKNQWKDNLGEILQKQEKINMSINEDINEKNLKKKNNNMINKIFNKEINIDDLNKSIIEEDLVNYISYLTEENNKGEINIKNNIDKSYNWKIIEELINDKNFGLESIINYFISVCTNIINDDNQIIISNDYIKSIIEYYANNLSKKAIDSIHNDMIKTFLKIDEYVEKNKNMYKILGNLLFILIDNKLYHIKFFNHYLKVEKQTQINLAIITRYCILSSGKFAKKYLNDFKQTKLFINNEIFVKYVSEALKDLLYYIQ